MEELIKLHSVTKDYGGNKGVFDISFSIARGEAFGFLGPNGAGKTTTIRMIWDLFLLMQERSRWQDMMSFRSGIT